MDTQSTRLAAVCHGRCREDVADGDHDRHHSGRTIALTDNTRLTAPSTVAMTRPSRSHLDASIAGAHSRGYKQYDLIVISILCFTIIHRRCYGAVSTVMQRTTASNS
ncbi:hypothetical protein [Mycobacterium riyadhense]|uniref:Uncharacterized protein n=1 Tax=Mycobacterium riyadhense TaxID=486698 RepID=A0A653EQ49_9MYCO|nr:hypothetical protein [Mycobacterium riyadhense]VTO99626.1 hypothetical protein BIN_B_03098 [Mycobacterium riyadhense]